MLGICTRGKTNRPASFL